MKQNLFFPFAFEFFTHAILDVLVGNKDCADLEIRKIYQVLPDDDEKEGYIRVIDESGEDYRNVPSGQNIGRNSKGMQP